MALLPCDPVGLVNATRLELEAAGSPSYVVALCDGDGLQATAPMTFARRQAAQDHAAVLDGRDADYVAVIAREASGRRAIFTVFDAAGRKLHQQLEVVEQSIIADGLLKDGTV